MLGNLLDRPAFRWLNVLLPLLGAALTAVIAWQSVLYALASKERGEATNMLKIGLFPFQVLTGVGMALFCAVLLHRAWKALRGSTPTAIGIAGMLAMLLLMFARMPIGLSMMLVGAGGIAVLNSPRRAARASGRSRSPLRGVHAQRHTAFRPHGRRSPPCREWGRSLPHGL